ncbi:alpha/beta fold hydrolase [Anaerosporobacter sp.]
MFLDIEDTKLHYEIEGDGVPIFIIHGNHVDYRLMYGCLEPCFTDVMKYKRIYIDIPGLGKSIPGVILNHGLICVPFLRKGSNN